MFFRVYVDSENPKLELTILQLKLYGAVICPEVNDTVSHVLIHSR